MTNAIIASNSDLAPIIDETKLTPFIPKANLAFVATASDTPHEQLPYELLSRIFSFLGNFQDLASVSRVCKRFYNASKVPAIWKSLLKNYLPNVDIMSPSTFTADQQVKIIFQRIFAEQKQLEDKKKIAKERISRFSNTDACIIEAQNVGLFFQGISLDEAKKLVNYALCTPWDQLPKYSEAIDIKRLFLKFAQSSSVLQIRVVRLSQALIDHRTKYNDQAKVNSLIQKAEVLAILLAAPERSEL